ncbi:MAG: hypothetical protein BGN85_01885 [Alphaproteobacteria bacterium 64-11]|nr:GlsB/YeaQ/YmgE family stress response membrane protein [Alphaproteobacteria bacterium]OJU09781.1 MAG: hypothetical protein BGN85_01885 [Alphaproteobacteria bacterium 64-11]
MVVLGWIVFGAFAGWIASALMGRQGSGCLVNIAQGLVGALVGGFLFRTLSGNFTYEQHGIFVSMVVAVIGAVIVLVAWGAISRR